MEFRILGELDVRHNGSEIPIKGALQRKALAILLLESGRTVSMHRLIEALWEGEPPATARRQVRNIVAAVRRSLAASDPIERSGDGYRLRTDATDWNDFRMDVAKAKTAGDCAETHRLLRKALQRWRGPVLAGLDCEYIAAAAAGRDEQRIAALEDFYETGLALGLHREMTGELQSLVAEHPYRQSLNGHLMLALYRSGNGAAALQVYTALGGRLADELGIEPDRRLRDLYVAILREDPSLELEPPTALVRPEPASTEDAVVEPAEASPNDQLQAPARTTAPEPAPQRDAAKDPSRLSPPPFQRLITLGLLAFVVVLAASGDGRGLFLVQDPLDPAHPLAATGDFGDPLWTYPAMESGSAVMRVEAGLLILDGNELRLEADGELVWSKSVDSQAIPGVAVFSDTIILYTSAPIDQPWNTGVMTGINIRSGEEFWSTRDRWPVARTEDAIITVGCATAEDGSTGDCVMESIDPDQGLGSHWQARLDSQPILLRTEAPYDSPWDRFPLTDNLLFRTYSSYGQGHGDQLSAYDTDTGELLGEFAYVGVEAARINGGTLILQEGATSVAGGPCEARVSAYNLRSEKLIWERFVDTAEDGDGQCLPPTPDGTDKLIPATLQQSASVVWLQTGDRQWSVPEPSTAELLIDDALVTTDEADGDLAVWDVWSHEQRWTANRGEMMWARGSTLWVLDREAIGLDCGGMVGYSLETGESVRLPGSLVYLSEDEVVTAENGTWQAWPADPWS